MRFLLRPFLGHNNASQRPDNQASHAGHSMSNQQNMTLTDFDETWFLIVSLETFTHSQFQHYMLYGFRARAIALSTIILLTYNLQHL